MSERVTLQINGTERSCPADPELSLLSMLREQFDLTGAKISCAEGSCGACTVLIDGEPVRACVTPASFVAGRHVLTIEGVAFGEQLHPLQQAFLDHDAFQCGYCTPGMIMSALGLLQQHTQPDREMIVEHMQGNICRCGVYSRIIDAIAQAAALQSTGAAQ
jgi:aerobic-type carbon monoxide dehydrogenase small subunit (CoxS/CutS family)